MLKDIITNHDDQVGVAVIKDLNDELAEVWNVYLVNNSDETIHHVFVTCKGYGMINNEHRETAVTRYTIGDVDAGSAILVEPVDPGVFVLNNEYFITFYKDGNMIDKKITFNADTISDSALEVIEGLDKKGIFLS